MKKSYCIHQWCIRDGLLMPACLWLNKYCFLRFLSILIELSFSIPFLSFSTSKRLFYSIFLNQQKENKNTFPQPFYGETIGFKYKIPIKCLY